MATFNTNQNRQFYVATSYGTVNEAAAVGIIKAEVTSDPKNPEAYLYYKGKGGIIKSDAIPLNNITYAKLTTAADMVTPLKAVKVVLDSTINSGNPISGQDYILRINLKNFYGMSDADQYFKDAAVHATAAMASDKKEFYKAMVKALNMCFSREVGATANANPYLTFSAGTAGSEDGIYITEKEQDWALGTQAQERVYFDVFPTTIYDGTNDLIWGTVTDTTVAKGSAVVGTNAIGNGKTIADMEYFYLGERGDQYRYAGWPNVIITEGLAAPATQYDVLDIHYFFTDTGVNSYKSEKDITIAAPTGGSVLTSIVSALGLAEDSGSGD